jgi:hypothetical protein
MTSHPQLTLAMSQERGNVGVVAGIVSLIVSKRIALPRWSSQGRSLLYHQ